MNNMPRGRKRLFDDINQGGTKMLISNQDADEATRLCCICKKTDDNLQMIQCDTCFVRYHFSCASLSEEEGESLDIWICPKCAKDAEISASTDDYFDFEGRVTPKDGWGKAFILPNFILGLATQKAKTRQELLKGYNLFKEEKVIHLSSNKSGAYLFFRSMCRAAMKNQSYTVTICFSENGEQLEWLHCTCPAGITGDCKHCLATLFLMEDYYLQGLNEIPDSKTCTEKLQSWSFRNPKSRDPILVRTITFIKHDPAQ